ncbi:MAG: YciI family protein [Terriglobia bacterium]
MKYYAALLPMLNIEKSQTLRSLHLEFLARAQQQGQIFARGRFTDGAGGLVIYQAETLDEATKIAQSDPYVVNGARRLEIHEWDLVMGK